LTTPLTVQSLANQAFEKIIDAMVRGEIEPGSRISEAQIARQFGISRGPLREALGRLEGKGLVVRRPNIGVHAAALSKKHLLELFNVREALEGMAARLAATEMTDEERAQLIATIDKHGRSEGIRKGTGYYQGHADEDFHLHIVNGSHSDRLIKILSEDVYYQVRIYRYRSSVREGRARAAFAEHRAIVDALVARNPDDAEAAMRRHIGNARLNLSWEEPAGDAEIEVSPKRLARGS
jgi:DNA-binding GntR family transcriptional regulator